jgi:putative transposase
MVTYKRLPIIIEEIDLFKRLIKLKFSDRDIVMIAACVLPDHFHMLINPKENNLSYLVKSFKLSFSKHFMYKHNLKNPRIWQYRFWDHIVRNKKDLNRHIDYIHYNPVKHGLVNDPFNWPHSSIGRFYKHGYYPRDWGIKRKIEFEGNFGE